MALAERKRGELFTLADEKRTAAEDEGAGFQLHQFCEDFIEVAFPAGIEDMDLEPQTTGSRGWLSSSTGISPQLLHVQ